MRVVDVVASGTDSRVVPVTSATSVLRFVEQVGALDLGYSTATFETLDRQYAGHDRVVIFTDEQANPAHSTKLPQVPQLHIFDLGGYSVAATEATPGRHTFGGFSDATFKVMAMVERSESAGWDDLLSP